MGSHKALGRGLEALFTSTVTQSKTDARLPAGPVGTSEEVLFQLEINKIKPNRHQPRAEFNQEALEDLAESIKQHGIAQPLVVTEMASGTDYELVMGERRLRAAKLAGLEKVPCIVKKISNRERFEMALIENLQREDLNAMEEAIAIDGLMREFNLTQEEVAKALGKSRSGVANTLRFLKLHEDIQSALRIGKISEGHAKWLAGFSDHSEQLQLLKKILDHGFSVRELEAFLQKEKGLKKASSPGSRKPNTPEIKQYEEEFQRVLGRRVEIQSAGKKGWIRFAFYSPWDLDNLCKRLGLIKEQDTPPSN